MQQFPNLVAAELKKARAKHRGIQSRHEGYAVLLEEVDELWEEIKAQDVNQDKLGKELVQVAAMCQRFAEDCYLADPTMVVQELRFPKGTTEFALNPPETANHLIVSIDGEIVYDEPFNVGPVPTHYIWQELPDRDYDVRVVWQVA